MQTPVPLVDLAAQRAEIAVEVRAGWDRVLERGRFVLGPELVAFEEELAASVGAHAAVGTGSGTDALEFALRVAGVGPGDSVLMPANTFSATAASVVRIGAHPRFVDVQPDTLLLDLDQVAGALDRDIRAVVPVHLFGRLASTPDVLQLATDAGAVVVEDAAQSHGAARRGVQAGGFGVLAATSFYPSKNLGAYGDGGAVLVPDPESAERLRAVRDHGVGSSAVGWNSRLDELQAVVLRAKLRRLPEWNRRRCAVAARYDQLLSPLGGVERLARPDDGEHAWHLYVVQVPERDAVLAHLRAAGIGASVHYGRPLHLEPRYRAADARVGQFPIAERAATRLLSLPMGPHLDQSTQDRVITALAQALGSVGVD